MDKLSNAIISVRPPFAAAIVSGIKTVEFRRRIPLLGKNTCLWIYSTMPVGAIIGKAFVKEVMRGTPKEIWQLCEIEGAIRKTDFDLYFKGSRNAVGIRLHKVQTIKPVGIDKLRALRAGFHPPQVILRITEAEAGLLSVMSKEPIAA